MAKFMSRKFILTILIAFLSVGIPVFYKSSSVSDSVTLVVLGILGGIGTAYSIVNFKEAKLGSSEAPK